MGHIVRPKTVSVYGALIHLYPQSFQKQYSTTMQQTFTDMLEAERTAYGRLLVWVRALADLPLSATKEHITKGKDFTMNRNTKLVLAGALVAILFVGLASFWQGSLNAKQTMGVERVPIAQLADAMQQDHFYSDYGNAAVLFSGKVLNTQTKNNASLVTFSTGRPYAVVCQFPKAVTYTTGQTISVAAPAGSADRQPHGVLLHNCLVN